MVIRSWGRCVGAGVVALAAVVAAGTARAQMATVTVKSAGDLLDQFRTLAKQADPGAARQMLDGLDALDQGGALKWLDRTRPVAATADLVAGPAGGPDMVPAVTVFLPITGRDEFLDGIKGLGLAVDDQPGVEGFSHKIAPPNGNGQAAYLLSNPPAGYAVVTTVAEGAKKLSAVKPADLRPARSGTVLVGVRIDRIPEKLKSAALSNVKQRNDVSRQRKDGETDEQYQGRLAGIKLTEDAFASLLRDGRELTLDADVREKAEEFTLALGVDARPGTPMAASLGSFGTRRGRFTNLWGDAAVNLQGVMPIPEAFRTLIRKSVDQQRAKAVKESAPDDARMVSLIIDALAPTLTGEAYDAGLAVGSEAADGKDGTNVVLFAVGMKDTKKVEAALREAITQKLKPADREKVELDHAKGADGTSIHRITVDPKNLKPEEFGEPLMFLAFPDGAAVAAVGGNGLAVLKRSLGALRKPPADGTHAPQVGLDFAAVRFAKVHSGENEAAFREAAGDIFKGADAAKDRLHIGLTGEAARLRLLLEADLPVLRLLVKVGAIQQKAKAAR